MKRLLAMIFGSSRRIGRTPVQRERARLQCECLEDRRLMSAAPIAAPIAKPISGPALVAQPARHIQAIGAAILQHAAITASSAGPYSPLTYQAYLYAASAKYWYQVMYGYQSNLVIVIAAQRLQNMENSMALLARAESYYEAYGYNGTAFRQYYAQFYLFYHAAVHEVVYWWHVNNG